MAEKKRPKLTPRQLRKLFAMRILSASGKGDKRKVAYKKPEKKGAASGGGGQPATVAQRLSALREVAAGTRSPASVPERVGRYAERAQAAEQAALRNLEKQAKQRMGEDYYGAARKQRVDAAKARLERVRTLKRSIQQGNVPDAAESVRTAGSGAAQRVARQASEAAAKAAQAADIQAAAKVAKAKRTETPQARVRALLSQVKKQQRDLYGPTDIRTNKRRKERYAQLKKRERTLERIKESLPVLGYGGL